MLQPWAPRPTPIAAPRRAVVSRASLIADGGTAGHGAASGRGPRSDT